MEIVNVPLPEIFADHEFNCRGFIKGTEVVDLARSIKEQGLLQPLVVQPFKKEDNPDIKYRIVAGYRRYTACRVNKMKTVPCVVRNDLSDADARILNLTENLKRKDLNKLQEAQALQPLQLKGFMIQEIAEKIGMSRGWVEVRTYINLLPEVIQQEIAAGLLTDAQIREVYSLRRVEQQFDYVKEIKKQKMSGRRKADVNLAKVKAPNQKRIRKPVEILDMVELIAGLLGGGSLTTIALAWAGSNCDDYTLHRKIKEECEARGILYDIPPNFIPPVVVNQHRIAI